VTTQLVVLACVIVFAVIGWFLWDRRYRGNIDGAFQATDEVFKDPSTGKMVRVYEDPTTGKRQYREES
jgi:hypothetical protein